MIAQEEPDKSGKARMPRLFNNGMLDATFSQVHFSVPLLLYFPLIIYFIYRGIWIVDTPIISFLGLFFVGYAIWTFLEYSLHRWWLHWIPDKPWGKQMNFWMHGIHHGYTDETRVIPLGRSLPGFSLLWVIMYFTIGPVYWHAIFSGLLLGYLSYEVVHYATHHVRWKNKWFKKLQNHHMHHHYRNPDSSFGFTGIFWDRVFKTRFEDIGDPHQAMESNRYGEK